MMLSRYPTSCKDILSFFLSIPAIAVAGTGAMTMRMTMTMAMGSWP